MKQIKRTRKYLVVLTLVGFLMGPGLPAALASKNAPAPMVKENFSALAEDVNPAVVHIRVEKTGKGDDQARGQLEKHPFGEDKRFKEFFDHYFGKNYRPDFRQPGLGSGFILDKDGYIVTNYHVIKGADKIIVILKDDREYPAEIIGKDPHTDIALIKINAKQSLPTARLGSSDNLEVGEWVAAIGSPFGLEYTMTAGIVSAKGRVIGSGPYDDFIQTDASINPGNSGGPLINMKGEVVGINTMIVAGGHGIGFAIPIDMAKGIFTQLKTSGEVTRGWLGVTIQDLKGDLAKYYGFEDETGVLVTDVVSGDPADRAGIQPKDVIVEINGKKVTTSRDLTRMVANFSVNDKVEVKVSRNGNHEMIDVTVGKRPLTLAESKNVQEKKEGKYGFQVADTTPEIAQRYNVKTGKGIIVVGVTPDSKASAAGIQQGDVIVEFNRENVDSVSGFKAMLAKHENGEEISLLVKKMEGGLAVIQLA